MMGRKFEFNDHAKHDHIVVSVTNTKLGISFNKERYNVKQTMAADSNSQFELAIQEPITQKIHDLLEMECGLTDCIDCETNCPWKKMREAIK